jgi:competence protein ComFC
MIKMLKYARVTDIVPTISTLVTDELVHNEHSPIHKSLMLSSMNSKGGKSESMVVPIPLYWWRRKTRWFNQSELLATAIGKRLGLSMNSSLLIREKNTASQAGKLRAERLRNMSGAFSLSSSSKAKALACQILLIDDVWTTGATMREAANVLKRAGVKKVWGLTVAR